MTMMPSKLAQPSPQFTGYADFWHPTRLRRSTASRAVPVLRIRRLDAASVPLPCHNEQKPAVGRRHLRTPKTASDVGKRTSNLHAKRTDKEEVTADGASVSGRSLTERVQTRRH
jgi:hypothetical protein